MFIKCNLLSASFVLIAMFATAGFLWAVVGTGIIEVTDDEGNPIKGATVTLTGPNTPPIVKKTDEDGVVTIETEEGEYDVEIVFDGIKKPTSIKIPGKIRVNLPPTFPSAQPPWRPVPPGSNIQIKPTFENLDDVIRTSSRDQLRSEARDTAGNVVFTSTQMGQADQAKLDQTNDDIVQGVDVTTIAGEVNIGLGSYGGSSYAANASLIQDTRNSRRKVFYPWVSFMIGQADVDLDFSLESDPSQTQTFDGDGLILGGGVHAIFFLGTNSRWFGGGDYNYQRLSDLDMTVTPTFIPQGTVPIREDINFEYESHRIQGIVGYNFTNVAPYGGVRGTFRDMKLDGDIAADFSQMFPGFTAISELSFNEEFEENTVEGVAGVDFRFGHLVAGIEGSFDANNFTLLLRGGFGF